MKMKKQLMNVGALIIFTLWTFHSSTTQAESTLKADFGPGFQPTKGTSISGPYSYKNLDLYLVHDREQISGKSFLTLEEGLKSKKVIVHETSQVNELSIENISKEEIFVQSGDIVKGGQQDRVISFDFILPPLSGRVPITSFCVEHGRWSARGTEDVRKFESSGNQIVSKDLKIATKYKNDQGEVWEKVGEAQKKLSGNLATDVASPQSSTSLQLALENKKVVETAGDYEGHFNEIPKNDSDVIGFVFVINGKINSGDSYLSHALFTKLWPKLLHAASIEAITEWNQKIEHPTTKKLETTAILSFLNQAETGSSSKREITKRNFMITKEGTQTLLFETDDNVLKTWIHKNYIQK